MRRFGLIGRPLGHSASAAYFAAKFEREGIADCTYTLYELPEIGALERLLAAILKPKAMKEYGAVQEDIPEFAASTVANQQRLLKNNYVELSLEEIQELYQERLNG